MEAAGEKFFENLKNGLDSHDKLWYPVVTARLVKPNQSSSDSLQRDACNSLWGDSIPPFHSPNDRESGLWFAPLSLRAARGALVRRSVQKRTKCGTHRLDHLCAPLFVLQRLSLWESWREAPERARTLTKNGRRSDDRALTKTQLIAAQRFFPLWLALSVTSGDTSPKGRGRTSAELSLDTPGECTIIMCVGKTRKVVFLRNDKMGGNE